MIELNFSDETLMAFADGELDGETRIAVETAMTRDPAIAERIAQFTESRARAKAALGPLLDEPVPDALRERVAAMVEAGSAETAREAADEDKGRVITFVARRAPRFALPLAASVALVVGAVAGYVAAPSIDDRASELAVAGFDRPGIAGALDTVASGVQTALGDAGDRLRAISTYRNSAGALCREFEVDHADRTTVVAVACRADRNWAVQFAVVAGQAESGYAPASSLEALDAYLRAADADTPMSLEEEAAALAELR